MSEPPLEGGRTRLAKGAIETTNSRSTLDDYPAAAYSPHSQRLNRRRKNRVKSADTRKQHTCNRQPRSAEIPSAHIGFRPIDPTAEHGYRVDIAQDGSMITAVPILQQRNNDYSGPESRRNGLQQSPRSSPILFSDARAFSNCGEFLHFAPTKENAHSHVWERDVQKAHMKYVGSHRLISPHSPGESDDWADKRLLKARGKLRSEKRSIRSVTMAGAVGDGCSNSTSSLDPILLYDEKDLTNNANPVVRTARDQFKRAKELFTTAHEPQHVKTEYSSYTKPNLESASMGSKKAPKPPPHPPPSPSDHFPLNDEGAHFSSATSNLLPERQRQKKSTFDVQQNQINSLLQTNVKVEGNEPANTEFGEDSQSLNNFPFLGSYPFFDFNRNEGCLEDESKKEISGSATKIEAKEEEFKTAAKIPNVTKGIGPDSSLNSLVLASNGDGSADLEASGDGITINYANAENGALSFKNLLKQRILQIQSQKAHLEESISKKESIERTLINAIDENVGKNRKKWQALEEELELIRWHLNINLDEERRSNHLSDPSEKVLSQGHEGSDRNQNNEIESVGDPSLTLVDSVTENDSVTAIMVGLNSPLIGKGRKEAGGAVVVTGLDPPGRPSPIFTGEVLIDPSHQIHHKETHGLRSSLVHADKAGAETIRVSSSAEPKLIVPSHHDTLGRDQGYSALPRNEKGSNIVSLSTLPAGVAMGIFPPSTSYATPTSVIEPKLSLSKSPMLSPLFHVQEYKRESQRIAQKVWNEEQAQLPAKQGHDGALHDRPSLEKNVCFSLSVSPNSKGRSSDSTDNPLSECTNPSTDMDKYGLISQPKLQLQQDELHFEFDGRPDDSNGHILNNSTAELSRQRHASYFTYPNFKNSQTLPTKTPRGQLVTSDEDSHSWRENCVNEDEYEQEAGKTVPARPYGIRQWEDEERSFPISGSQSKVTRHDDFRMTTQRGHQRKAVHECDGYFTGNGVSSEPVETNADLGFIYAVAAVVIQTAVRRFLAELRAVEKMYAVQVIQTAIFKWLARKSLSPPHSEGQYNQYKNVFSFTPHYGQTESMQIKPKRVMFEDEFIRLNDIEGEYSKFYHSAATEIQRYFRGWWARDCIEVDHFAATAIQRVFRGWWTREALDVDQFCAVEIQRITRGHLCRMSYIYDLYCIIVVQSLVRRYIAFYTSAVRLANILLIQAIYRGHRVRSNLRQYVRNGKEVAATLIQAQWRCYDTQMNYVNTLADILIVQSVTRRWLTLKKFETQHHRRKIQPWKKWHYDDSGRNLENTQHQWLGKSLDPIASTFNDVDEYDTFRQLNAGGRDWYDGNKSETSNMLRNWKGRSSSKQNFDDCR